MSALLFKQLCIICLFILLGACGVTIQGIDVGRVVGAGAKAMDVGEKSEADEILMGEKTAQALLAEAPLANDEQLQIYVAAFKNYIHQ